MFTVTNGSIYIESIYIYSACGRQEISVGVEEGTSIVTGKERLIAETRREA